MTIAIGLRHPALWIIVATSAAAGAGLSARGTIPLAMAGLLGLSLGKYVALKDRADMVGATGEFWKMVGLSVLNSAGAASAAHLLGVGARWLWMR